MEFGFEQYGKWLIGIGLFIIAVGAIFFAIAKIGIGRLPGDVQFGGEHWKVYVPLASCIIISILLTLILWLINCFKK